MYKRYHKPNECLRCIDFKASHPLSIAKGIVRNMSARISRVSATTKYLAYHAPYYNEALVRTEYKKKIKLIPGEALNNINTRVTKIENTYNMKNSNKHLKKTQVKIES